MTEVRFFASARSAGRRLPWGDGEIVVEDTDTADFTGLDLALFSNGKAASLATAPKVAAAGAHRDRQLLRLADGPRRAAGRLRGQSRGRDPAAEGHHRQPELHHDGGDAGARAAAPGGRTGTAAGRDLPGRLRLRRRGRGRARRPGPAVADRASGLAFDGHAVDFPTPIAYVKPIAYNVLPLAGSIVDDGSGETDEEQKLRNESRKILHIPDLLVSGTCVRVPVFTGHSLAVHAEFADDLSPEQATELLANAPGVRLMDVPTPLDAAGRDPSLVGRIRVDQAAPARQGPGHVHLERQPAQGCRTECGADR